MKAPSVIVEAEGKMNKKPRLATLTEADGLPKPKISKCEKPKISQCETRDGKSLKVKSARTKKPPPLIKGQTKMTAFFRM